MSLQGAPAIAPAEFPVRRSRAGVSASLMLDGLCGLSPAESSQRCGRTWCNYLDDETGRCALLDWDIPGRLGPEALGWFAAHRTTKEIFRRPDADEVLLARTCSL